MEPDWGSMCKRLWASRRVRKRDRQKVGPKPPRPLPTRDNRRTCAQCHKRFAPTVSHIVFCSDECGARYVAERARARELLAKWSPH